MLGLVRYQAGDIKLLGHDVKTEYNMLYGKIGVLFDENGLYERMTAVENMDFCNNAVSVLRSAVTDFSRILVL